MHREVLQREGLRHLPLNIFGEGVEGLVQGFLIALAVFLKPGALVIEREIPQEGRSLPGETLKFLFH